MLIKYQTLDGAWRTVDQVAEVINHGFQSCEDIWKLAEMYDGNAAQIDNAGLPVVSQFEKRGTDGDHPDTVDSTRFYLVVTVRGERRHMTIPDIQQGFLLSDDGKTVDRLLH